MTFEDALEILDDSESFRATVYAMNTLLIEKGVYTAKEFEDLFCEHAANYKAGFKAQTKRAKESRKAKETSRVAAHANL
ncbi:MAG TPA: hypothetical protein VEG64_09385 [Candidatus Sulfotelmatobacter sp.]|nr:hypothetical protein [Candidatus Sulfotelmatobacter sp.]